MKQKILDEINIEQYRYFEIKTDEDDFIHIVLSDTKGSSSYKVAELLKIKTKLDKYKNECNIEVSLEEIKIKL